MRLPSLRLALQEAGNGLDICICPWQVLVGRKDGTAGITSMDAVLLYSLRQP